LIYAETMKHAIILFILYSFFLDTVFANENMTPAELEKWFNEDEPAPPVQVDEGKLVFLAKLPDKPLLHSINEITIDANSIDNGWVRHAQCAISRDNHRHRRAKLTWIFFYPDLHWMLAGYVLLDHLRRIRYSLKLRLYLTHRLAIK